MTAAAQPPDSPPPSSPPPSSPPPDSPSPGGPTAPEITALRKAVDEARATARDFVKLRTFIGVAGVVGLASTWAVWGIFSGTVRGLLLLAGLALFFIAMLVFFAWNLTRAIASARRRAEELEHRLELLQGGGRSG